MSKIAIRRGESEMGLFSYSELSLDFMRTLAGVYPGKASNRTCAKETGYVAISRDSPYQSGFILCKLELCILWMTGQTWISSTTWMISFSLFAPVAIPDWYSINDEKR